LVAPFCAIVSQAISVISPPVNPAAIISEALNKYCSLTVL